MAGSRCVHLGLRADWLVTGHVHRAGPWPGDDTRAWVAPTGAPLVGTGSWVQEPALGSATAPGGPAAPGTYLHVQRYAGPHIAGRVLGREDGARQGDLRAPPLAVVG